nr:glycoside hydrolase [Acidobacteriota bacterium]
MRSLSNPLSNPLSNRSAAWALAPALLLLATLAPRPARAQQVTVVDMIPNSQSAERNDDSEPNLAVDPAHPLRMAASAFSPDPLGTSQGALFLSINGGAAWTLKGVLPGSTPGFCGSAFCDVTLRFAATSGRLYVSDLTADPKGNLALRVSRFDDIFGGAAPLVLETYSGPPGQAPDQPYIQATTVLGGQGTGSDRVYVGQNDARAAVVPKTATVDVNPDAGAPSPAPFSQARIETRPVPAKDGSAVRTAIHPSGTVYAAFYGFRTSGTDIVVVRDDHWGTSPMPFTDLKDPSSTPGIVVAHVPLAAPKLATQRVGRSQISLAVDPNDVRSVWLVWGDGDPGPSITLHLRHSTDGGVTWSGDLRTVSGATNPALAVNSGGGVGFLYQQLLANGAFAFFVTTLEIAKDGFATPPTPIVLAKSLIEDPLNTGDNPIGDYEHLMAVGKDFFGVFSADNTPDMALFPSGVSYQREVNFAQHVLYDGPSHTFGHEVQVSIDPFFFHVSETTPDQDFFVRDWTDATSHDPGLEPSTHSIFYTTSDVWNRVENLAGALSTPSAPQHEDPQDAMGGQNYAFVRIGRKGPAGAGAPDVQVTAHFLYSNFGVGMPYVAAAMGATDPSLSFTASDTELALPDGQGLSWLLPPDHSTHICMAVEIQSPADPFALPDLEKGVPGWPTLDTAVLYDNNKAQRNMALTTLPPSAGPGHGFTSTHYALVHNAALYTRDIPL